MRTLLNTLLGLSLATGMAAVIGFFRRQAALGVACGGALVGSLALGYYAATHSDGPSLRPLWGWSAGLLIGAAPGAVALLRSTRRRP